MLHNQASYSHGPIIDDTKIANLFLAKSVEFIMEMIVKQIFRVGLGCGSINPGSGLDTTQVFYSTARSLGLDISKFLTLFIVNLHIYAYSLIRPCFRNVIFAYVASCVDLQLFFMPVGDMEWSVFK
jgi:hypothetical protein